jgi:hypothetical protein
MGSSLLQEQYIPGRSTVVKPGWATVQGNSQVGSAATSTSCTFGSSVAVGDLVVVCVTYYSVVTLTSVTDNASTPNTYMLVMSEGSGGGLISAMYYSVITTGGAFTVKATFTSAGYGSVTVQEYSFTPGTISVASTNAAFGSSASPASGNVTFTAPVALVCGNMGNVSASSVTASAPFSLRQSINFFSGVTYGTAYIDYLNAAVSPQNPNGTMTSASWAAIGAAFHSSGDL